VNISGIHPGSAWVQKNCSKVSRTEALNGAEKTPGTPSFIHNDYLQMGLEHGIPALCAFIGMWWLLARRTIRHQNETMGKGLADNVPPWLLAMIGVYVSAFLTDSFTYWIFTWATVSACFGVAAGLMTGQAARSSNTAAPI